MKKSKDRIGREQILIIAFVWLLLFAIPILFGKTNRMRWNHIIHIWTEYLFVFIIFLINRLLLIPQLFFKGKKVAYFIAIIAIITLSTTTIYVRSKNNQPLVTQTIREFPPLQPQQPPVFRPDIQDRIQPEFIPPYGNLLMLTILLIGFDSGLLFFSKWTQSEQNKLKVEKESIKNKMDFLQTQISPHFFMNTLNNIHALVDIDTEEAKAAIIKLSQLMDYMLYESQTSGVALTHEMDFIKSYIELMKLRFTDDVGIAMDIPSVLPDVKIPPLLSISFIENAFKHGISYESQSFVNISLYTDDKNLTFNIKNSVHSAKDKKKNSGIGIENARKRLDLIYGNNYVLNISSNENTYNVNLIIPV